MKNIRNLVFCLGMIAFLPSAFAENPRTVKLEVTVIRFKPADRDQVLQDIKVDGNAAKAVAALREVGRSVDVLYRGVREIVLEDKAKAKFDATETRPVILLGKPGVPVPPATVFGLTLEVTGRPVDGDRFVLAWDGSLVWSPEMMDRRGGLGNTMQFIGKAAQAAEGASKLAGEQAGVVKQASEIGLAVAEIFSKNTQADTSVFELPVVKTVALSSSRVCKSGQAVITTTAAEAGTKEPQTVYFILEPTLKD